MRCSAAIFGLPLALVLALARVAAAQSAPDPDPDPDPDPWEPAPAPDPAPAPELPPPPPPDPAPDRKPPLDFGESDPASASDPAPAADPAPSPEAAPPDAPPAPEAEAGTKVEKKQFKDRGLVLGFEIGFGAPGGTTADVYGSGLGTGFIIGYRMRELTLEWHFHHSHAVRAKHPALRGETTQGEVSFEAVLARFRLVDDPLVVEVAGGPAMLSVPQIRITEDVFGNQVVDTADMRGVGIVAGGFAGMRLGRHVVIGAELRATLAAVWEMPGDSYVVPGMPTTDGGVMYTESSEDASGKPWSLTAVMRILL